jgi:salicylate hydroxylase
LNRILSYQDPSVTNFSGRRCIIVGAGIAGLTAALALEKVGFSVLILEKSERLEEAGAGLQLSPNATSILAKLGVLEGLLPSATIVQSIDLVSMTTLKPLLCLETAPMADGSAPFISVHRADLQCALLSKINERPSIELVLGVTVVERQTRENSVDVRYNALGNTHLDSAQCFIGADGIWSATRTTAILAPARFSGYVTFRQTVDRAFLNTSQLTESHLVRAFIGPNAHLVAYPIARGERVNLVFITKQAGQTRTLPGFSGFASELVQDLSRVTDWTSWHLHTVDAETPWRLDERSVLIGDAAHAMLPFAAQGAAMAIEDAFTLAHCLSQEQTDVNTALTTYEALRRKRVKRVAMRSRLNAFAYHASGPIAFARNLVFAAKGQRLMRDLEWLYGYRAPDLENFRT